MKKTGIIFHVITKPLKMRKQAAGDNMDVNELIAVYMDEANFKTLSRYAYKLTGNHIDAEDLLGNLAVSILSNEQLQTVKEPMPYFMTCLRNSAQNMRKHEGKAVITDPELISLYGGRTAELEAEMEARQMVGELKTILSKYPEELVDAFIKFHLEDYSIRELANSLNMKESTLSKHFSRMRERIRDRAPFIFTMLMRMLIWRNLM